MTVTATPTWKVAEGDVIVVDITEAARASRPTWVAGEVESIKTSIDGFRFTFRARIVDASERGADVWAVNPARGHVREFAFNADETVDVRA